MSKILSHIVYGSIFTGHWILSPTDCKIFWTENTSHVFLISLRAAVFLTLLWWSRYSWQISEYIHTSGKYTVLAKKANCRIIILQYLSNLGCHRLLDVSLITTKKEKKCQLNFVTCFLIAWNYFLTLLKEIF